MRILSLAILLLSLPVIASSQLKTEVRGGLAIGSHSTTLAGLDLLPRLSTSLIIKKDWQDRYSIFASGSFLLFGCENGFCRGPSVIDVKHYSATAGLEARYWRAWLRIGSGVGSTAIRGESELGMAVMIATGLRLDIGRFELLPGATYRWMSSENETIALVADLGVGYRLRGER